MLCCVMVYLCEWIYLIGILIFGELYVRVLSRSWKVYRNRRVDNIFLISLSLSYSIYVYNVTSVTLVTPAERMVSKGGFRG